MAEPKSLMQLSDEPVNIGLDNEARQQVIDRLGKVLGNQHVLYLKLRNVHWNIVGSRFHELHELFEKQYTALALSIDETAERIRKLGGIAPGSLAEMLELATLEERSGKLIHGDEAILLIVTDHETVARDLRGLIETIEDDLGDVGTADFLTDLLQKHEEDAWMLRVYLDRAGVSQGV